MSRIFGFGRRHRRRFKTGRSRARAARLRWLTVAAVIGLALTWQTQIGLGPAATGHVAFGDGTALQLSPAALGGFAICTGASQPDCVVDGDTIRYRGAKIRLEDIDAPEVFSPKCASEAALGRRATQRLTDLVNYGPFQVVQAGRRDEDRYGRKLRVLMRNGRSLGDILVAEGLARPWDGARRSWCG